MFLLWTLSMYLFAVCDLFYISTAFRFDGSIFKKDFDKVEYSHEVECTGVWYKTIEWKMHFNKISMMKFKGTLMQIWKSTYTFVFIQKILSWNLCILNPTDSRVPGNIEKCLFTSIQKKQNMLKISLLFNKSANFAGE